MIPDLVVLGNLAVDDIVYPDGESRMGQPGGAAIYVALGANLWGVNVGMVSRVGSDYPSSMLEALSQQGIDLAGTRELGSPGLRTWLLYEGELRRVVHRLDSASHAEASPTADEIPTEWTPRAVHIAPLPIGLQAELVAEFVEQSDVIVSVDPYELLSERTLETWTGIGSQVDYFFLSEDEIADGQWRRDPGPLVARITAGRLKTLFYKQGSMGGTGFEATTGRRFKWSSYATTVVDQTGAGDAFAGGTLAGLLQGDGVQTAVHRGVVSASFALESQGADALLEARPEMANERLKGWFGDL
jgi:sugar/nucleoside kinase (ribokinase family)